MSKHLHIISLDVPFPADYGGVVDLFCKLKYLAEQGIKIHLHCFTNGRQPQDELNKYCVEVNYYQRKKKLSGFSFRLPFIVSSRINKELAKRLQQDDYPVLMEGIHCSYLLHNNTIARHRAYIRLHNTEFEYYRQLAGHESNPVKKLYYLNESRLLKKYERAIAAKSCIITVSESDAMTYQNMFGATDVHYLPVFIPWTLAVGKEGKGCFCLYHGNLSVNENEKAVIWLQQHVFAGLDIPFVVAGKDPSRKLISLTGKQKHTCLVANPTEKEMQDLLAKAQVNILPSFNKTGIKLKLLNALFNGRHCLVNAAAADGSGLQGSCHTAEDGKAFGEAITYLYQKEFTSDEIEERQGLLQRQFNNAANAQQLITWLYSHYPAPSPSPS
ncbi:MAG: glycosyltransferase [Ferruginibacter sp.]